MTNANKIGGEVLELLRSRGFDREAIDLEQQIGKLDSPDAQERADARKAIESRCNPRWLGDLYLEGLSLKVWWDKLEALSRRPRA